MPAFIPDLGEAAIQAIVERLRAAFNANLDLVRARWEALGRPQNLPVLPPSAIYPVEGVEPLRLPALFVVLDRTDHDLAAQQWLRQRHHVYVDALVESAAGAEALQRIAWRYAQALWLTLHDQDLGATRVQITQIVNGPTAVRDDGGGSRTYRKGVSVRLDATQREAFEHA